jgi:hypothetical protein
MQAQRAVLEHAIAALVGADPSGFVIAPRVIDAGPAVIPLGVPSAAAAASARHRRRRAARCRSSGGPRRSAHRVLPVADHRRLRRRAGQRTGAPGIAAEPVLGAGLGAGRRGARRWPQAGQVAQAQAVLDESGQRYRLPCSAPSSRSKTSWPLLTPYRRGCSPSRRPLTRRNAQWS